jgi:hypothetical protein
MGQRRKPGVTRESAAEQQRRDQEVLRANRELTAYFRGRRTEREAAHTSRQNVQEPDRVDRAARGPGISAGVGIRRTNTRIIRQTVRPPRNQVAGIVGIRDVPNKMGVRVYRAEARSRLHASEGGRDGRVVDGGGLENHCGGNSTGGSNPSPSASL